MTNYNLKNNIVTKSEQKSEITIYNLDKRDELDTHLMKDFIDTNSTKIDYYDDSFYGSILLTKQSFNNNQTIFFKLKDNRLIFLMDKTIEDEFISVLNQELKKHQFTFNNINYLVLLTINIVLNDNYRFTKTIETNLDKLEDTLITNNEYRNFNKKLLKFRKEITKQRKATDNIEDFLENLLFEMNNESIDEYLKLLKNKSTRNSREIKNLSEHTIQLKEVYQNQLDVNLNNTMNFFTIISTIFLPLTLITSWYGMNFKMPEFILMYGYLIPIVLSILCIILIGYLIRKYNFIKRND